MDRIVRQVFGVAEALEPLSDFFAESDVFTAAGGDVSDFALFL
jgi:hypothetical protein